MAGPNAQQSIEPWEGVQRSLPAGSVLRIDHGLPFLIVYRQPQQREDAGTDRLITAEAAHLIVRPGDAAESLELVRELAAAGSAAFGAFLVLELWASPDPSSREFVIHAPEKPAPETVCKLSEALGELRDLDPDLDVVVRTGDERHPPDQPPLITVEDSWQQEILLLGLEVPPVYRDPRNGLPFPAFLRLFRQGVSRALRRSLYEFIRVQTTSRVANYLALGTRSFPPAVPEIDGALCQLERSFDWLLLVLPINVQRAWTQFRSDQFGRNPELRYRLLPIDPDLLKRRLFAIEIEQVDDPALADLFEDKRQELDTQLTMLRERGSKRFLRGSQRLYGDVDDTLFDVARRLLREVPRPRPWTGEWVDAQAFHEVAQRELAFYRQKHPGIRNTIQVRRDVTGLLVSEGNLLIDERLRLRPDRVAPLIQHEVGTHVLTYVNGRAQPLEQLSLGLAEYDELQEGLAVLAEYLVGGLDPLRMRLLAARVVGARCVQDGADFVDTFRVLTRDYGYSAAGAWHIALRLHASGGFTRDLIYLRGLLDLLELLRDGAELEPLYLGKIGRKHLPIVEELRQRGILREPALVPRFLAEADTRRRLAALRRGLDLQDMICAQPA